MEKVNFTLTNLARTVLAVLISFTVGLTGLQAQSYPTVNANGSMACDSANVTTVEFVEALCDVPTAVNIEFVAGGSFADPTAILGHQWQVAYVTSGGVSVATAPLSNFESAGGGSLKGTINFNQFTLRKGGGTVPASWADSTIGFFVFQVCDGGLTVAPADTAAPARRYAGAAPATTTTYPDALVENRLGGTDGNTKNMVRIKSSLGAIDSTLCNTDQTSGTTGFIILDPLIGEVDTLWSRFNDAKADSQTVSICLSAPMGIPNAENFTLEVYEDLGGTAT